MKLGFIGCGNMATAIIRGILENGLLKHEEIGATALTTSSRIRIQTELKIQVMEENRALAAQAEILVLAVKPQFYEEIIAEIRDVLRGEQVVITLAPGKTIAWLEKQFAKPVKIIRTMPNTPAMVQEGMTAICPNKMVTEEELAYACELMKSFGEAEIVPERLIDAVVAVSGSSPAYVYMMIEAMADAAVAEGMPRTQAYKFAAKAVLGSAKMVLETGKHPGELKDMVCSPGGTTIQAVKTLEKMGFRSAIMEAMQVCAEKSKNL